MSETAQFAASAPQYDRFMGRYALTLAPAFADAAGVTPGVRVLDVGCGPGGLTSELSRRTAAENVAAIDPAPQFVAACRDRLRAVGGPLGWTMTKKSAAKCGVVGNA